MALKFKIDRISSSDIEEAASERGSFSKYEGPTPPPGTYKVKLDRLWLTTEKNNESQPVLKAVFQIEGEEGDREVYNGCPIWNQFQIPLSKNDKYFAIRVNSLNDFLTSISKGSLNAAGFSEALNEDRIQYDTPEKLGEPINQIGSLKLPSESLFKVKLEHNEWQGNVRPQIHYIISDSWKEFATAQAAAEIGDVEGLEPSEKKESKPVDSLDDILGL